ncbi:MAG: hypothetical protein ABIR29_02405 [Chthoniobacterales bacterium]
MALILAAACATAGIRAASATPDPADAQRLFSEAKEICEHDHGTLWGQPLCGPILLVDPTDRSVLANQADAEGKLQASGTAYRGVLAESVIIANTPIEWAGVRWTELAWPLTPHGESGAREEDRRQVLLAHELFHRIQPELKLTRPEVGNAHLDTGL